jgi:hypothetical protein
MLYENNQSKVNLDNISNEITLTWENIGVYGPDKNNCITRLMNKPHIEKKRIIQNGKLSNIDSIFQFFKNILIYSRWYCQARTAAGHNGCKF